MRPESFWWCVPCDAVIRLGLGDSPTGLDGGDPRWLAAVTRERSMFRQAHCMHPIESLTQATATVAFSGPLSDPAALIRWEVRNASRGFVVEGSRMIGNSDPSAITLDHPFQYRCLPGRLRVSAVRVGIPVEEISQAIDDAVFPHVLPPPRLRALTDAATKSMADLNADRLEVLFQVPTDPATSMARLADEDLESVIARLYCLLDAREGPRLAARLRSLHAAEALLCAVTRYYEVDLDS